MGDSALVRELAGDTQVHVVNGTRAYSCAI